MFGCCVAGRLLQTDLVQLDPTHLLFPIPSASKVNHICVFLLGTTPFPDGWGATVHWNWPGKGFQLLGMLSNEKPSAIFRVRGLGGTQQQQPQQDGDSDMRMDDIELAGTGVAAAGDGAEDVAQLGLSVEPLSSIQQQLSALTTPTSLIPRPTPLPPPAPTNPSLSLSDPIRLSELILKNLFNYLSSFTHDQDGSSALIMPDTKVEIGAIQRWYEGFVRKVRVGGVGFLERAD